MQVFVPDATSLEASVRCLDQSRAGNQCWRESKTLLSGGWPSHPAHQLFDDYPGAFAKYNMLLIDHVYENGWCRQATHEKWHEFWRQELVKAGNADLPHWWGDERIHSSHRSALLFKDPEWYCQFDWEDEPIGPDPVTGKWNYVWPEEIEDSKCWSET